MNASFITDLLLPFPVILNKKNKAYGKSELSKTLSIVLKKSANLNTSR